ncbi:MAG: hypothetical protein PGN29_02745 [Gordonia paraffinivorans]
MVNADNLPESLAEYLTVWCADLLAPLDDDSTRRAIATLRGGYEGGPYPDRLTVQRLVEMHRGIVSGDAVVGEILVDTPAGVGSLIRDLGDPERRQHAFRMLSAWPDTTVLVPAVTAAADDGLLDDAERDTILDTALRTPPLPRPIPLPDRLRPLPPDYPESYDDYFRRAPRYEWAPEITE